MKSKWIHLGEVSVDSGQVMVVDPCYLDGWNNPDNIPIYEGWNYKAVCNVYADEKQPLGGEVARRATVCMSGHGDGGYQAYARVVNGTVHELRVVFIRDMENAHLSQYRKD